LTPIVFRKSALADLEALASHFDQIDRATMVRIVADIGRSIARLADFPRSGEAIPHAGLRRIVSHRYRFTISYFVAADRVEIVGVFRFQDRDA
jgi:plasmid stabilization system protein ParE